MGRAQGTHDVQGVSAIIFDMDGILVDSEPLNFEALRRVLARYGVTYTEADNEPFVGVTDLEHFRALRHLHRLEPVESELIWEYTDVLLRLIQERTAPMPGIPEVLHALGRAGYPLAVASSSTPEVIAATLGVLGVGQLFKAVVSGAEVARGKPAPDVFLEAARRLRVPPAECLVVEDSRNGVLAAKAAEMRCVAIPCRATRHQDLAEADARLGGLEELLALVGAGPAG